MKNIWQITLPVCSVLMFSIGAYTTVYMVDGQYKVDISLNTQGFNFKTYIDKKQECFRKID